jgi:hypothetical protein
MMMSTPDTTPRIRETDEIVRTFDGSRVLGAVRRARSRYAVGQWVYHAVLPSGSTVRGRRGPEEFSTFAAAADSLAWAGEVAEVAR